MNTKTSALFRKFLFVFLCLNLSSISGFSQEEESKWQLGGYVKYLQIATFAGGDTTGTFPLTNSFFHNRLNLKYYANDSWTIAVEARNRLFWGEQVKLDPSFGDQIDPEIGLLDLSIRWADSKDLLLHTIFDRAYVNYAAEKWELRVGRQRINWGINTFWNPNDLFNALNFLDFDYEERPGSDAIRFQYYTGAVSSMELAWAPDDTLSNSTAAALYKFNIKGYDFQALAGYFRGDLALGGGWAGSIKNVGFKGEGTAFIPLSPSTDSISSLNFSLGADYSFDNGIYITGGILYNSNAKRANALGGQSNLFTALPSAKNLFPSTWTFAGQGSGQINPLMTFSMVTIYAPDNDLTILVPTLTYSIVENWDLDLIAQSVFASAPTLGYGHAASSGYIRLRWSF